MLNSDAIAEVKAQITQLNQMISEMEHMIKVSEETIAYLSSKKNRLSHQLLTLYGGGYDDQAN